MNLTLNKSEAVTLKFFIDMSMQEMNEDSPEIPELNKISKKLKTLIIS